MSTRTIAEWQRRAARVQVDRYTVALNALSRIARVGSEADKRRAIVALKRIGKIGLK